jgi:hypothetical protein
VLSPFWIPFAILAVIFLIVFIVAMFRG